MCRQSCQTGPCANFTFALSLWEQAWTGRGWLRIQENPRTGERIGFPSFAELPAFLRGWARNMAEAKLMEE